MDYRLELEKMASKEYVEIMLDLIKKEDLEKRKRKYSAVYCLYHIHLVFTELQKWRIINFLLNKKKNIIIQLYKKHKKNQKIKTQEEDKARLCNRYIVENVNCNLKQYKRVCTR
jgi:hypothetical protein